MAYYKSSTPTPGPYNVPATANATGGARYNRIVSASATFFATGSNGGVLALTSNGGCTVTLIGGGTLVVPAATTIPLEVSVYSVTAGSAYLYYR